MSNNRIEILLVALLINIVLVKVSCGQKMDKSEFSPISNSKYKYELRISYEGIIGCILIFQIDSTGNSKATFSEYAYRYSFYHMRRGDYSKDKFRKMDFVVNDKYLESLLDFKSTIFPITDSLECYSIGLDGNSLTIEVKNDETYFKQSYWEFNSYNKDCLLPYGLERYYSLIMSIRNDIKSESIFLNKLEPGSYGNYGESYITKYGWQQ